MVLLLKKIINWYFYFNNELADPRIKEYPFMSTPFPMLAICAFYLYFVKSLGPRLMHKREPMNIDKSIIAFNISQIIMCSFLVYKFVTVCFFRFNWFCEPIDYGTSEFALVQLYYTWIYHLIKLMDLLDTVFFVLRKKYSQITFLHVYHHTGMVILTWIGAKFLGGGHGLFVGFANCLVHTCMYFYYLMSIWDEKYKKSIWWKKYITQLQIAQFLILAIIFGQTLFYSDCSYPKSAVLFIFPQNIFILTLFGDFYYKAYIKGAKRGCQKKSEEVQGIEEPNENVLGKQCYKENNGRKFNGEVNEERFFNSAEERKIIENKKL